jgi:hypothetical protein
MKVQQKQLTTAKPPYGRIRECPGPQSNKSWTTGFVTLGALSDDRSGSDNDVAACIDRINGYE